MVLGYEACSTCGWKNIFWQDDGEPQPQLISGLALGGGYVCPVCRESSGSRMHVGPIPANTLLDKADIEARYPPPAKECQEVIAHAPMSPRQHLRALARWCMPWNEDTRLWLISCAIVFMPVLALESIFDGWGSVLLTARVVWQLYCLFLAWRVALTGLLLVVDVSKNGWGIPVLRDSWREFGQQPLFVNVRERWAIRQDAKLSALYLRQGGMDRREAKKCAKQSAWMRSRM